MKKKLALCTPIPEAKLDAIREYCDITLCGELKHGKGNVTEAETREECLGAEHVNNHTTLRAALDKALYNLLVVESGINAIPTLRETSLLV